MFRNRTALSDIIGAYELVGAPLIRDHRAMGNAGGGLLGSFRPVARPAFMTAQHAPAPAPMQYQSPAPFTPPGTGAQVVDRGPTKTRFTYLPVNSVATVAAGASETCSTQPQALAFRPQRILVPASIAPDFTIDSIFCGIKPQFVATGSIAAETFTQDARGVEMLMDTVTTSQNFTLNVTNQSGAARKFRATVFGDNADD